MIINPSVEKFHDLLVNSMTFHDHTSFSMTFQARKTPFLNSTTFHLPVTDY